MNSSPPAVLVAWFNSLPSGLQYSLLKSYIFMSSPVTDDFTLNAQESCNYFYRQLAEADLPFRRIARLLTIRTLFSFLLEHPDLSVPYDKVADNVRSLQVARFYQAKQEWQKLCQSGMSDAAIKAWLDELQR